MTDFRRGMHNRSTSKQKPGMRLVFVLMLALALLPVLPSGALGYQAPQDPYARTLPAPPIALAGSHDGQHVAAIDEEARYTFLLDAGERERTWEVPSRGYLGMIDPTLGEEEPTPIGVSMTPDGDYWAGATSFSDEFGGRVHGFAHWSDEPIWTFELPDGDTQTPAVQPTVIRSGGEYHAVGTDNGKVHVLLAGGDEGTDKKSHRTYKQSNEGEPFGKITDLAVSHDGGLFLIGTDTSDGPSLHLYTDIFFKATFQRITEPVKAVTISADGTRGAAVTGTGEYARVHFLDTQSGTTIWEHTVASTVRSLALSADGSLLAVGMQGGRVHLYQENGDIKDSYPKRVFTFDSPVTSLDAADDGHAVTAATSNGQVHLLDLRRGKPLWSHEVPAPAVSVSFAGDQSMIVVGSVSGEEGRVTFLEALDDLEHITPPAPRLLPGQTQEIDLQVANNGNRMEPLQVRWRAVPESWTGHDGNLSLAPGETGRAPAAITVPAGQRVGDYELRFDLVTRTSTIPFTIEVRVPEVTSGNAKILWSYEKAVPGGAPAAFLVQLQNTGNTMNELALGYSGLPSGWDADFTGARETRLRPGEDRQVVLTARAPADAPVGDEIWFDLVVAWQHGEQREPLRVQIVGEKAYKTGLDTLNEDEIRPDDDDDGLGSLIEQLKKESDKGVEPQDDEKGKPLPALIPFGGLVLPLGAVATALAVVLLVVRRRTPQRVKQAHERAVVRRK